MYNRTILILFALFSNYFRLKRAGSAIIFAYTPLLFYYAAVAHASGIVRFALKPCGVFQQSIVFGAFDGHAVPAGRYNDIAVHER